MSGCRASILARRTHFRLDFRYRARDSRSNISARRGHHLRNVQCPACSGACPRWRTGAAGTGCTEAFVENAPGAQWSSPRRVRRPEQGEHRRADGGGDVHGAGIDRDHEVRRSEHCRQLLQGHAAGQRARRRVQPLPDRGRHRTVPRRARHHDAGPVAAERRGQVAPPCALPQLGRPARRRVQHHDGAGKTRQNTLRHPDIRRRHRDREVTHDRAASTAAARARYRSTAWTGCGGTGTRCVRTQVAPSRPSASPTRIGARAARTYRALFKRPCRSKTASYRPRTFRANARISRSASGTAPGCLS